MISILVWIVACVVTGVTGFVMGFWQCSRRIPRYLASLSLPELRTLAGRVSEERK